MTPVYTILWFITILLFLLWLIGLGLNWGAWLWILFAAAVVLLLFTLFTGGSEEV